MTGKQFLAEKFASAFENGDRDPARSQAYLAGFEKALEMASGMILSLENPRTRGLSVLIQAIGRAEVDKVTGRRVVDIQDEERLPS